LFGVDEKVNGRCDARNSRLMAGSFPMTARKRGIIRARK
jgi:hypothetical protein